MALGQYLFGVFDGSSLGDYWDDAEGVSTFLIELASPDSFRGSCSSLWYVCGPGITSNKSSDCASWFLLPSYSAT